MKSCKIFLHLLSIFFFCVPFAVNAQSFKTVDFERLLMNHPLMKNFDPETGRFRDTPSEIVPVALLQQRIISLTSQIGNLEKQKVQIVTESMLKTDNTDEEDTWERIKCIDSRIEAARESMLPEQKLLEQRGVPGYETILAIASRLVNDTVGSQFAQDRVVINKLPRFRSLPPDLSNNDLRRFFDRKSSATLEKYLSQAGLVGLMFSQTDQPILYSRQGAQAHEAK